MNKIIELINKEKLTGEERLFLLEELYWADWDSLNSQHPEEVKKILEFLRNNSFDEKELSLILKLYSNPDGAYVEEFSYIISKLYNQDKIKFIRALHQDISEGENISYLFRNNRVIEDGDIELKEILSLNQLSEDEIESANTFFRNYKNVCNT